MLLCITFALTHFLSVYSAPLSTSPQSNKFSCVGKTAGFYPDPLSCSSYYICVAKLATHIQCPSGLEFNSQSNFCDWPKNAQCSQTQTSVTSANQMMSTTKNPFIINGPTKLLVFTNAPVKTQPTTKNPFIINGPTKLLVFTNAPVQTQPTTKNPFIINGPTKVLTFTNVPVPTTTTIPTHRPTKLLQFTNPPLQTTTTKSPVSTNLQTILLNFTNKPLSTSTPSHATQKTTAVQFLGNFCHGKTDGLYSDPSQCGYYYQCSYGFSYHEPCAEGLVFNDNIDACDFPFKVPACFNYQG